MKHYSNIHYKIGNTIFQKRQIKGMTQAQLGNFIGITYQQLQKYEKGAACFSLCQLLKISEILNINISQLFAEDLFALTNEKIQIKNKEYEKKVLTFVQEYNRLPNDSCRSLILYIMHQLNDNGIFKRAN